jgi:hypothetical protein
MRYSVPLFVYGDGLTREFSGQRWLLLAST